MAKMRPVFKRNTNRTWKVYLKCWSIALTGVSPSIAIILDNKINTNISEKCVFCKTTRTFQTLKDYHFSS